MANKKGPRQKSEYGKQLEEKQALRETYALRERQFRKYFRIGTSPELIVRMLETRIDNVVYRSGFAPTIRAARQLVSHGHIMVNGRKAHIPSLQAAINDVISIHTAHISKGVCKDLPLTLKKYEPPPWLTIDKEKLSVKIIQYPTTEDPMILSRVRPIIEFYSR